MKLDIWAVVEHTGFQVKKELLALLFEHLVIPNLTKSKYSLVNRPPINMVKL